MTTLFQVVAPHIHITGVAAITSNNVLGVGDNLAVRCPRDMRLFKTLTMGKVLVMGRKTVDSLPQKLLGRVVVCLTSDKSYQSRKCDYVVHSLDELMGFCLQYSLSDLFICGGGQVYSLFKGYYDRFYLTYFKQEVEITDNTVMFDIGIVEEYTISYRRRAVWDIGGMFTYEMKREVI